MTTLQDVNTVIEQMVQEKTLSLDGMTAIQKLKDRVTEADRMIEQLTKKVEEAARLDVGRKTENELLKAQVATIEGREKDVAIREKNACEIEKGRAVAEATANAYKHSLTVVFAPNTVRESVQDFSNRSFHTPQGYQNEGTTKNKTTQVTEGYLHPSDGTGATDGHGNKIGL